MADLNEEFLRVLSEYPAEAIESAFRGWRAVSPFFPAVSHILDLCMHWVRRQAEETEMRQRRLEREKLDAARAAGELVDFADIKKELLSIAVFPDKPNEHQKRQQAAIERLRRSEMPPALPLTPEQIKSRRADEQAEIRRYSER